MKRLALLLMVLVCIAPQIFAQSNCTLTFLTENVPDFTLDQPAHFTIEGVSGTEPYTFTIVGGALPAGLHMNSHGKITGKPTELADTTVLVNLTDAAGCMINQTFTIRVTP
ncbi:MAG: hypothetical protein QOK37_1016 [Thermoanaerobaculia bacterium]|nr:hypothetical protein [Thermoanaerobaculia bacterium]